MNIGIIGVGTVGQGVVNLLAAEKVSIEKRIGEEINILWLCDTRRVEGEEGSSVTRDFTDITDDYRVDTVVELIGGNTTAYDIAVAAISSGKNLITANKHLLATRGRELFKLAKRKNVKIFYEAAIAGGIPAVSTMYEGTFSGGIRRIRGILNGTANYVLSQMEDGYTYEEAISHAQKNGYAEADPTYDVEGIDTGHKISLLSYLVWGELPDFDSISIEGIQNIRPEDIRRARRDGKRIKLIGEATNADGKPSIRVGPGLVDESEQLFHVGGAYNAIETEGTYLGKTFLYGQGAGMYPTASAVISDLYKIANSRAWKI